MSGCCGGSAEVANEAIDPTTRSIRVFEPALCCNTGVCGEDLDQALVNFTADLAALRDLGVDIARHNLANDPGAFAANQSVSAYLQVAGSAGLPLTLVDGVTVMTGAYPTRAQLLAYAGVATGGAAASGASATDATSGAPAAGASAAGASAAGASVGATVGAAPTGVGLLTLAATDTASDNSACGCGSGCC